MKFTKDTIPENSGLAAWHFAKLVSAMDGQISKEEHIGLVNTMKVTVAISAVIAANKGEDPEEAQNSFMENKTDLLKFWNDPGPIDDAFIDHALGLITDPVWANFAIAVALFSASYDGLDDSESFLMDKAFETWGCEEEEVTKYLGWLVKVASGQDLDS